MKIIIISLRKRNLHGVEYVMWSDARKDWFNVLVFNVTLSYENNIVFIQMGT